MGRSRLILLQYRTCRFQDFKLNIEEVGREVDSYAAAAILELKYRGLKCVGKKLHSILQATKSSY